MNFGSPSPSNDADVSAEARDPLHILMITQWFDPEPTFKGLQFAKELQRRGHQITVLTGFPNYPGGRLYAGYRRSPWRVENLEGIKVVRVWLYPSHSESTLGRIVNYLSFAMSSCLVALFLKRPGVVYCYHPPGTAALAPLLLHWFKRVPFVLDVQDLWPDTLAATGMVSRPVIMAAAGALMRVIYRGAAHIVVLSEGFAARLRLRGVPSEKITVIPNWTHEAGVAFVSAPLASETFNVLFAGNMGRAQGLDAVLDAARQLAGRDPSITITLVGDGIEAPRLIEKASSAQLGNVTFLSRRNPEDMPALFQAADVLLVHLKDDPLFAITIPSKTQAYLQAGKPILMAVRGDAADMVLGAGAGIAVEPANPAALAEGILALKQLSAKQREYMGHAGKEYYNKKVSLQAGVDKFESIFSKYSN